MSGIPHRFKACVEYDGTDFFGFQKQKGDVRTVQGSLEAAIGQIAKRPIIIYGSGRTDTGVHATGQIISFDLIWPYEAEKLYRAINSKLPKDIVVRTLNQADAQFHPRYDARRRRYTYQIYTDPLYSPLERRRSWHVPRPLDIEAMNTAAASLIGKHDFATFGQAPKGDNTNRDLFTAEWQRSNNFLIFTIEANAFLYRMVRRIVGSLKQVGEGSWTVEQFADAFASADRQRVGVTAPAHGLCLTKVDY